MTTKQCTTCGEIKPLDEFIKVNTSPDGRGTKCKQCYNKWRHEKRLRMSKTSKVTIVEKTCPDCNATKPVSEFYKEPIRLDGLSTYCKECTKSRAAIRRALRGDRDNIIRREKMKDPEYRAIANERKRESHRKDPRRNMLSRAKKRAKARGFDFNLDLDDIKIPDRCPLLNIPIKVGTQDDYSHSPTLDRIDNSKGYIKGNVWVLSMKANSMKNSSSFKELYTFCKNVLKILYKEE